VFPRAIYDKLSRALKTRVLSAQSANVLVNLRFFAGGYTFLPSASASRISDVPAGSVSVYDGTAGMPPYGRDSGEVNNSVSEPQGLIGATASQFPARRSWIFAGALMSVADSISQGNQRIRWMPSLDSADWPSSSYRVCCVISGNDPNASRQLATESPHNFVDIGNKIFAKDPEKPSSATLLCASGGDQSLSGPFVQFVISYAGYKFLSDFLIGNNPAYARPALVNSDEPSPIRYVDYPGLSWPQMGDLFISVAGEHHRVWTTASPGIHKSSIVRRASDDAYFACIMASRPVGFMGPVTKPFALNALNAQVLKLFPWQSPANGYRLPAFVGTTFSTFSVPISKELASRSVTGFVIDDSFGWGGDTADDHLKRRLDGFLQPGLMLAGIASSEPPAMWCDIAPLDFGAVVKQSSLSYTVQALPADAAFPNPQEGRLNAECITGLSLASGSTDNSEKRANLEPRGRRANNGALVDGPFVIATLKTHKHTQGYFPVDDEDVSFPVVERSQHGAFLFRGKKITSSGITFLPWSSNFTATDTFGSPRGVGAFTTQAEAPSNSLDGLPNGFNELVRSYSPSSNYKNGQTDLNGKVLADAGGSFLSKLTTVPTPGDAPFVYNYEQDSFSNSLSVPPLLTTYTANQSYDEPSFMAGSLASMFSIGALRPNLGRYNSFLTFYFWDDFAGLIIPDSIEDNHPQRWANSFFDYNFAFPIATIRNAATERPASGPFTFRPSLAGKEFICTPKTVFGNPLESGLFHALEDGEEFSETATEHFSGVRVTRESVLVKGRGGTVPSWAVLSSPMIGPDGSVVPAGSLHPLPSYSPDILDSNIPYFKFDKDVGSRWFGKAEHACTFKTNTVELYVRWGASLQSPGPWKVGPPYDDSKINGGQSVVSPTLTVRAEDFDDVKSILVAQVWARAAGEADIQTTYEFPEKFCTSGTFSQRITSHVPTATSASSVTADVNETETGHTRVWQKGEPIHHAWTNMEYLGGFAFNREQTQQLLDGQSVEATYWYMDDAGSESESLPVCVAWHNDTFGTYKLRFRLVTE
jgi:hypothetical protein